MRTRSENIELTKSLQPKITAAVCDTHALHRLCSEFGRIHPANLLRPLCDSRAMTATWAISESFDHLYEQSKQSVPMRQYPEDLNASWLDYPSGLLKIMVRAVPNHSNNVLLEYTNVGSSLSL